MSRRQFGVSFSAALASATASAAPTLTAAVAARDHLICAPGAASTHDSFDPLQARTGMDFVRIAAQFNRLVRLDDDLQPKPELAETIVANEDASQWRLVLRAGVRFRSGAPLRPQDVLFTLDRISRQGRGSLAGQALAAASNWRQQGENTVIIDLKQPDRDFPRHLGTPAFAILRQGEAAFDDPDGTGPFRLVSRDGAGGSSHERRGDYWRAPAKLKRISLQVIAEADARAVALLRGAIDMAGDLPPSALSRLQFATTLTMHKVPSARRLAIICRRDRGPGLSGDFVMALKYLQRRDLINRTIYHGAGEIGNDHPVSTAYGADHCEALSLRSFDLARAHHHLRASGIGSAELAVADIAPGAREIARRLEREADRIGLTLRLKHFAPAEQAGMRDSADLFIAWQPMQVSPLDEIAAHFLPQSPENLSRWHEPRIKALYKTARHTSDAAKRHEALCQIQLLISNEAGVIVPVHNATVSAHGKTVHGVSRNPLSSMGAGNWPEYAWIEP